MKNNIFKLSWILLVLFPSFLYATDVSGPIMSNTTWTIAGSPYIVKGNILVSSGVTLIIDPGVYVKFDSDYYFQVDGTLQAIGTTGNMIYFTSNKPSPAPGDWGGISGSAKGIYFTDTSQDWDGLNGCIIKYCTIEYGGGIYIYGSAPYIGNCIIQNNNGIGPISGITNAVAGAIMGIECSSKIYYNSIHNNQGSSSSWCATLFFDYSSTEIIGNAIFNNIVSEFASDGAGGLLFVRSSFLINNNLISNNICNGPSPYGYAVGGIAVRDISTEQCEISFNSIIDNRGRDAGGIFSRMQGGPIRTRITYNNLYNNLWDSSTNDIRIYGISSQTVVNATNNYWGPITTPEMESKGSTANIITIYDFYDDFGLDRVDYGNWTTTPFPNIFSGIPYISSVRIEPAIAYTYDTLTAIPEGWYDFDGDPEGYIYQWKKNSVNISNATTATLDGSNFIKGNSITCVVTPFDGTNYGVAKESSPRIISNSPPSAPIVQLLPTNPQAGQDIAVDIIQYSTDADGDTVAYFFKWYECTNFDPQNPGTETWTHKVELDGSSQVSGVYIQEGDLWRFELTPYETGTSGLKISPTTLLLVEGETGWDQVYVGNNIRPTVTVLTPSAYGGVADTSFNIQWSSYDANTDTCLITLYYDTDNAKGNATLISQYQPDNGSHLWDTSGVPEGYYYVFLRIMDSKGAINDDFSAGRVHVTHTGLLTKVPNIQWGKYK